MKSKTVETNCYGIIVNFTGDGGSAISSDLHEVPNTLKPMTSAEIVLERLRTNLYNAAMDGIEALILGHACAGIDITTSAYKEGIESAVQGCANNMD